MKAVAFALGVMIFLKVAPASAQLVPRTVITLFDGRIDPQEFDSQPHQIGEMPLNYLGLALEYHDIRKPLPDLSQRHDVVGVLHWLWDGISLDDPTALLAWATQAVRLGKKYVILGEPGFLKSASEKMVDLKTINTFFNLLGINYENYYVESPFDVELIYKDPTMMEYEKPFDLIKPDYLKFSLLSDRARKLLIARQNKNRDSDAVLAMISPEGAYVASGYAIASDYEHVPHMRSWLINPWQFFRNAFETDIIPKADITTIAGRRIFYSHIDGDGWNTRTQIEDYLADPITCAEVIYKNVLQKYPDLPVTVAPIAADLDPNWAGDRTSQELARKIFSLSNVEPASHTYSHPFVWKFFEDYTPEKERHLLPYYLGKKWETKIISRFNPFAWFKRSSGVQETNIKENPIEIPRAFGAEKFDLDKELFGSIAYIQKFSPPAKKVRMIMWSGDTSPFEKALAKIREAGLLNINGGDARYDRDYSSYAWVSAVGKSVGTEHQIYSSNSNENTYTDLWRNRFFGFQFLKNTISNTETPFRIKPLNVYYHMYSGERLAGLTAIVENMNYVRKLKDLVAPITASHYSEIAQGFYSTQFIRLARNSWRVENHGRLATIRFDQAFDQQVDMANSTGVIGQTHLHGSLYVYVDELNPSPVITLMAHAKFDETALSSVPYLIDSRWLINTVSYEPLRFKAQGYGALKMRWQMPQDGVYEVVIQTMKKQIFLQSLSTVKRELVVTANLDAVEPVAVTITWKSK